MADRRRLQAEIDRCLKRVNEGVAEFDETYQKVHDATNPSQKEKAENELKKEIKKLQRHRDQIKGWCSSSDIKDKSTLMEYRRLIEQKMESFKVVERETKTKAYSKEGLGAASKLDPAQKEKDETIDWLRDCIDKLQLQNNNVECEVEKLQDQSKRKKLDKERKSQFEELRSKIERNIYHTTMLESVLRSLTNDDITCDKVHSLKQDVNYYIEENDSPDFVENDEMYEDLDLDNSKAQYATSGPAEDEVIVPATALASSPPSSNSVHKDPSSHSKKTRRSSSSNTEKKAATNSQSSSSGSSTQETKSPLQTTTPSTTTVEKPPSVNGRTRNSSSSSGGAAATPPAHTAGLAAWSPAPTSSVPTTNAWTAKGRTSSTSEPASSSPNDSESRTELNSSKPLASPLRDTRPVINGAPAATQNAHTVPRPPPTPSAPSPGSLPVSSASSQPPSSQLDSPLAAPTVSIAGSLINGPLVPEVTEQSHISQQLTEDGLSSLRNMAQNVVKQQNLEAASALTADQLFAANSSEAATADAIGSVTGLSSAVASSLAAIIPSSDSSTSQQPHKPVHITPLMGVAPLGQVPVTKDNLYQMHMLDAALTHSPHPSDSEKLRYYLPRNPVPTPPYYPQSVPSSFDHIDFFMRLTPDTLFFVFYYMEGTKAQYMAAKALKKMSWRFHTKYMMWFQRHETPKNITDEFEVGTYIFFDYEKWQQRKKEGFTFEYRYLEDRELN